MQQQGLAPVVKWEAKQTKLTLERLFGKGDDLDPILPINLSRGVTAEDSPSLCFDEIVKWYKNHKFNATGILLFYIQTIFQLCFFSLSS